MHKPLPTGKVPIEVLRRSVFSYLGISGDRILQGPNVGEDAAIIDMGDRVLIVATDPITGAEGRIGWLSVHINANDVASCGARPLWYLSVALLPEGGDEELLKSIMEDVNDALREIGVSLIGGHTETTPGLDRPILIGFMMGEAPKDRYVTTSGARPGDSIILTKSAGIEGTSILAQDLAIMLEGKIGGDVLRRGRAMIKNISVVPEAMKAMEVGGVHSLHDPTEGGLLNGLWELAEAAEVGLTVYEERIPIAPETGEICKILDIDPLKLLGSGAMLITASQEKASLIVEELERIDILATIIGKVTLVEEGRILVGVDGSRTLITAVEQDELYRTLDRLG
jgi:hydrogenase maturation factor